jgi:uncharacterized protein
MLFSIQLLDNPGTIALRTELRPAHKAYLGAVAERIAFAGPLFEADGETVAGSLLVLDFPSREAALEWLDAEPFTVAGVYGTRTIHAFANLWPQRAGFPPA